MNMNPFQILGLSENCSDQDVKQKYFELAQIWHPDKNKSPEAASRFKLISTAYNAIKDQHKRNLIALEKGHHEPDWTSSFSRDGTPHSRGSHEFKKRQTGQKLTAKWMFSFERFIHPRNLLVAVPIGILTFMISNYVFSTNPTTKLSPSSTKQKEEVDAWFNSKTQRYETPAPWSEDYKKFIINGSKVERVDKMLVSDSKKEKD